MDNTLFHVVKIRDPDKKAERIEYVPNPAILPKQKEKKQKWAPPSHYIPDRPYPKATYKWQAANIARSMRKKLDKDST